MSPPAAPTYTPSSPTPAILFPETATKTPAPTLKMLFYTPTTLWTGAGRRSYFLGLYYPIDPTTTSISNSSVQRSKREYSTQPCHTTGQMSSMSPFPGGRVFPQGSPLSPSQALALHSPSSLVFSEGSPQASFLSLNLPTPCVHNSGKLFMLGMGWGQGPREALVLLRVLAGTQGRALWEDSTAGFVVIPPMMWNRPAMIHVSALTADVGASGSSP